MIIKMTHVHDANQHEDIMTTPQVYSRTDRYHHILDQLENLFNTFDAAAPDCLRSRLIEVLGEDGGIWPIACFTGHDDGTLFVAA